MKLPMRTSRMEPVRAMRMDSVVTMRHIWLRYRTTPRSMANSFVRSLMDSAGVLTMPRISDDDGEGTHGYRPASFAMVAMMAVKVRALNRHGHAV